MLSFRDPAWSRREFLRVGTLGLGGLSLADVAAARSADPESLLTGRSVVFLFMHGGPPQTETFDPKMGAPSGIRSVTGEVQTSLPGVTYGSTFPLLAKLAHKSAVVRSFVTGDANHNIKPLVCPDTYGANPGSIFARVAGSNHPGTGIPTNVAVFPRAVTPDAQAANHSFGNFLSPGPFGAAFAPFEPGGNGQLQKDMTLAIPRERLGDRRALLDQLDDFQRAFDAGGGLTDPFREQAFSVLLAGVSKAFDLSDESPRLLERYDTSGLIREDHVSSKWKNRKNYLDHIRSLGRQMLLARRLCESGCGFVTVTTNFVWDFHSDENNAPVEEGLRYVGAPFDHAVSAFIEDVESRRLSDKILLVACGEMGRSPRVNKGGGRDHWGGLAPLFLYGGGLKMGQVVGDSTRDAGEPNTSAITARHLMGTIAHTLFDLGKLRVARGLPDEIVRLTEYDPIRELV
ncbi:MAG TPA: DUF1501 domain-containing protein [Planctomycetota bacterium]|nr:DUF1501 domain-containing protein [Planctomycetota bacterium]